MAGNRVEELEATVAELESTVEGLTEELVEAKERIRVLESELDAETPSRAADVRAAPSEEADPDEVHEAASEAAKSGEPQSEDEDADDSELGDDIIVA
ncbi:hypothetical protein G9464_07925 [Halostella sp. JP-L12]|uniref:DUF7518 family protein n=1 Tax=Halostella TaxID=1843185 RepID=UPI000EF828F8|nr:MULTISPECIES: hypothetical protein [Halostella]NHN47522.1 hypothetical protein [Halostella sp. JP-L12]